MGEALDARDVMLLASTLDPVFDDYEGDRAWAELRGRSAIWSTRPGAAA
jgi:hypothetical protein